MGRKPKLTKEQANAVYPAVRDGSQGVNQAAALLGVSRQVMYSAFRRCGLPWPPVKSSQASPAAPGAPTDAVPVQDAPGKRKRSREA